jgi:hypothetical protein
MSNLGDVFAAHLRGLKQTLTLMSPDERLVTVLAVCHDLAELYLTIAQLNHLFHVKCETGTLPLTEEVGHA